MDLNHPEDPDFGNASEDKPRKETRKETRRVSTTPPRFAQYHKSVIVENSEESGVMEENSDFGHSRRHKNKKTAEKSGKRDNPGEISVLLEFIVMQPAIFFVFLVIMTVVNFAPLWPRLASFVQGALAALLGILFWVVWKVFLMFNARHQDENQHADVLLHPKVKLFDSSIDIDEESIQTYMNILLYGKKSYDAANFDMQYTRTVLVTLHATSITFQFPKVNLPYKKYFNEKIPEDIKFEASPLTFNLHNACLLSVPNDLTKKQQVSKNYPIAIKFESDKTDGLPRTIFIFPRTNREKEYWFRKIYERIHFARGNMEAVNKTSGEYKCYTSMIAAEQIQSNDQADDIAIALNFMLSRIWFNLYQSKGFVNFVRHHLTHNLRRIKFARYFKHVGVRELLLSDMLPSINKTYAPWEDEQGTWFDFDIDYKGTSEIIIRTQGVQSKVKGLITDRESSTIDWGAIDPLNTQNQTRETEKKQVLEALTENNILPWLLGNTWVQQNITDKEISLHITVLKVTGTLTFNLGPPPSDRVWYGFRTMPELEVSVRPSYGNVSLTKENTGKAALSTIELGLIYPLVSYLEYIIKENFAKHFVYPNLRDHVIPYFKPPEWSIRRNL